MLNLQTPRSRKGTVLEQGLSLALAHGKYFLNIRSSLLVAAKNLTMLTNLLFRICFAQFAITIHMWTLNRPMSEIIHFSSFIIWPRYVFSLTCTRFVLIQFSKLSELFQHKSPHLVNSYLFIRFHLISFPWSHCLHHCFPLAVSHILQLALLGKYCGAHS